MPILHVTSVRVSSAENYELDVTFDDGTRCRVRLEGLLYGVFEPLKDPERFAEAYLNEEAGVVAWSGELDLAPEALKEAPGEELETGQAA